MQRRLPAQGARRTRSVCGIIFQNLLLSENSSVLRNVLCGRLGRYPWWRTLFRFPRRDKEAAALVLADLGLGPHLHRRAADTSGGEQQRAAVARALFQEPELLLADEPVSNLDAHLCGRVLGILRQEAHQNRRTVFCVLHDPALLERFAEYALSLDPMNPEKWRIREIHAYASPARTLTLIEAPRGRIAVPPIDLEMARAPERAQHIAPALSSSQLSAPSACCADPAGTWITRPISAAFSLIFSRPTFLSPARR